MLALSLNGVEAAARAVWGWARPGRRNQLSAVRRPTCQDAALECKSEFRQNFRPLHRVESTDPTELAYQYFCEINVALFNAHLDNLLLIPDNVLALHCVELTSYPMRLRNHA